MIFISFIIFYRCAVCIPYSHFEDPHFSWGHGNHPPISSDISVTPLTPWPSRWRLLGGTRGWQRPREPWGTHWGCTSGDAEVPPEEGSKNCCLNWERQWDILITNFVGWFTQKRTDICWHLHTRTHVYVIYLNLWQTGCDAASGIFPPSLFEPAAWARGSGVANVLGRDDFLHRESSHCQIWPRPVTTTRAHL